MWNARLDEAQAGIKIAGRNLNNLRYADDTTLMAECASSSPAFRMMYSAYKLNRQGDNIQPWHTPFPILNQSVTHVHF